MYKLAKVIFHFTVTVMDHRIYYIDTMEFPWYTSKKIIRNIQYIMMLAINFLLLKLVFFLI